jgi:hypothetical protein
MRIRIDVVEPYPRAERAEPLGESDEPRVALFSAPCALGIAEIEPISARVLRDDEQLLYAGGDQPLGLAHHLAEQAALEPAAQRRNDAEAAGVVAALRNFQIGVVARRKLDTLRRQKIEEGVVWPGHGLVYLVDHCLVLVRASDGKHVRIAGADAVRLDAEAAGNDNAAVFAQRLADCLERFLLCTVEEAAGVDYDCVGAFVARRKLIALGAELGDDAF